MSPKPPTFAAPTIEVACAAIAQKKLARSNMTRSYVRLLLGFAVGFSSFAAFVYFLGVTPMKDKNWFFFESLTGMGLGAWLSQQSSEENAACPVCKHDWEIKEGRQVLPSERMESWDACPGCGLLMADWALRRASEGKPRL
jgi:hypothetical protein